MKDRTLWLKGIGGIWLFIGIVGLLWGTVSLMRSLLGAATLPAPGRAFSALLISPWAQITTIALAGFFLITGWGLLGRHRWVQTVIVPAHLLFMVYTIVGWIAAYIVLGPTSPGWSGIPILCASLILANGGIAMLVNSVSVTEALSWLPLRTTPLIPLRCEFCGTPLDPHTNRCPECEAVPEVGSEQGLRVPPEAVLINLADETQYRLKPGETTLFGRGSMQNDVNLSNPTVSRHHAQIVYKDGHYTLVALRDLNGTFVNDSLVRTRTLKDGDEIRFGRARFRFQEMELTGGA